jgi:predicted RNA-binding protein YlqC (UPF0109 family)
MKEFLEFIVKHLVEEPERVQIVEEQGEGGLLYKLTVAEQDFGRVVGKDGRTARSLRTLLTAAGGRSGVRVNLEIMSRAPKPALSRR